MKIYLEWRVKTGVDTVLRRVVVSYSLNMECDARLKGESGQSQQARSHAYSFGHWTDKMGFALLSKRSELSYLFMSFLERAQTGRGFHQVPGFDCADSQVQR